MEIEIVNNYIQRFVLEMGTQKCDTAGEEA